MPSLGVGLGLGYQRRRRRAAIAQLPVISRGVPATDSGGFGGGNAAANAVDGDYGTYWRSVTSPNGGTAQWLVLDLRGVSAGVKTSVWCVWKNPTNPYLQATATLGSDAASSFTICPRNYTLQGHTSSGSQPAVGDVGWTTLATVTDNRFSQRIHTGLNLSTYNWFRFYCTAANGVTGATDDVQLQLDLRDASGGAADSLFVYGDSITMEAFGGRYPGNGTWTNGALENQLAALTGRAAPVLIDAGTGGWQSSDGDSNKVAYIGGSPCKYVCLNFGSNDANQANIDLTTLNPSGVNSTYAQTVKANFQSMVTYAAGLGKICVIPRIPYGSLSAWSAVNVGVLNTIVDQVVAANPGTCLAGPDLYAFFAAHTNCLRDALHPTYDPAVGAGKFNGLTGYENYLQLWRGALAGALY